LPVIAIIDILKSKFSGNDNILMLLIVIFIPFGAIIYFLIAPSKKLPNSTL
jgi:preprotein translocase subunit YajC